MQHQFENMADEVLEQLIANIADGSRESARALVGELRSIKHGIEQNRRSIANIDTVIVKDAEIQDRQIKRLTQIVSGDESLKLAGLITKTENMSDEISSMARYVYINLGVTLIVLIMAIGLLWLR